MSASYRASKSKDALAQRLRLLAKDRPCTFPDIESLLLASRFGARPLSAAGKLEDGKRPALEAVVSVITVTKDHPAALEKTIKSVIAQSYRHIEYIVMDGSLKWEQSFAVIERYASCIHTWLSYPDRGIYDAMNRAALLARGEWLLFLNGGDSFYDDKAVEEMLSLCKSEDELVYGDHEIVYAGKDYSRIQRNRPVTSYWDLWHHMGFCHQSLLAKRELQLGMPFDIHNLSADYGFVLGAFLAGHKIRHIPVVLSQVDTAGISQKRRIFMEWERFRMSWRLSKALWQRLWLIFGFACVFCSTALRFYIQKLLGNKITSYILGLKYSSQKKQH